MCQSEFALHFSELIHGIPWFVFLGGTSGKNPSAIAGDIRDIGLIPGSGQSPGGGQGNHSSILAWRIPMDR